MGRGLKEVCVTMVALVVLCERVIACKRTCFFQILGIHVNVFTYICVTFIQYIWACACVCAWMFVCVHALSNLCGLVEMTIPFSLLSCIMCHSSCAPWEHLGREFIHWFVTLKSQWHNTFRQVLFVHQSGSLFGQRLHWTYCVLHSHECLLDHFIHLWFRLGNDHETL